MSFSANRFGELPASTWAAVPAPAPVQSRARKKSKRILTFFSTLWQYPLLALAFGPPVFRQAVTGTDTSQAHADFWSILQVGWIGVVALDAFIRFFSGISMPRKIRNAVRTGLALGGLFGISIAYSPGMVVSAEFTVIYLLTWAAVIVFVAAVFLKGCDWISILKTLRAVCFISYLMILATVLVAPEMVFSAEGGNAFRITGGSIGSAVLLGPIIAIISLHFFLHRLERRVFAFAATVFGVAATVATGSRGTMIGTVLVLALIAYLWSVDSRSKRMQLITVNLAGLAAVMVAVVAIGGDKVWDVFNRGQSAADIASASGRSHLWELAIKLIIPRPLGLGYVAGFRHAMANRFDMYFNGDVTRLGTAHNTYLQYLLDAGWLGLLCFLVLTIQLAGLVFRFLRKKRLRVSASPAFHALVCGAAIEFFCLISGLESSAYNIPLQQPFYLQHIAYALILGSAAQFIRNERNRMMPVVQTKAASRR